MSSLLSKVDLLMPFAPDFCGCEHPTRSTLIAESCLTSAMCTATRDTRNTSNSTTCAGHQFQPTTLLFLAFRTCAPRFSRGLLSCFLADSIGLSLVLCHPSMDGPAPRSV